MDALHLLHFLEEQGLVTPEQSREIADEQSRSGKPVETILANFGILQVPQILEKISDRLGLPLFPDLADLELSPELLAKIPPHTARSVGALHGGISRDDPSKIRPLVHGTRRQLAMRWGNDRDTACRWDNKFVGIGFHQPIWLVFLLDEKEPNPVWGRCGWPSPSCIGSDACRAQGGCCPRRTTFLQRACD